MKHSNLHKAIYNQLYSLSKVDVTKASHKKKVDERYFGKELPKEQRSGTIKRAEEIIKQTEKALLQPAKAITTLEKINAIKGLIVIHSQGFITDTNLLVVISDIVKGE